MYPGADPVTGAAILGCLGPVLAAAERAFYADADPWGFILFARNVESPDQLRRLTGDLRDAVGRAAPVLVDQEGGRVQRLRAPHWREFLPPLDQMALVAPDQRVRAMWLRGRLIADDLAGVGIDVTCTPNADIADADTHPFLRNRCYGGDVATVVAAARAVALGLAAGGILPVVKHMPGHGRARLDTHVELPRVDAPMAELMAHDFAPFRALADLPMAMTAHIVFSAIDPDLPATQSAAVIAVIRDQIGFGGLLMSDDLSMQALSGSHGARAAAAIAAGCDLVLHCNGDPVEMRAVVGAAGAMSGAAVARAAAALAGRGVVSPGDMAALGAELAALTGQGDV